MFLRDEKTTLSFGFYVQLVLVEYQFTNHTHLFFYQQKKMNKKRYFRNISICIQKPTLHTKRPTAPLKEEFLGNITDFIQTIGSRHQSEKEKQASHALHTTHDHAFTCDIAKISIWFTLPLLNTFLSYDSTVLLPLLSTHPLDQIHTFRDPTHPKA